MKTYNHIAAYTTSEKFFQLLAVFCSLLLMVKKLHQHKLTV